MLAECELCWPDARVVVLRDDQADMEEAWKQQGWAVFLLDEAMEKTGGVAWYQALARAMGLPITEKE